MRTFSLLLFLFVSFNSLAYPTLGDYVRFEAPYKRSKVILEKKIVEQDETGEHFLVAHRMMYLGEVVQQYEVVTSRAFLFTKEKIQNVLRTCVRREGARGQTHLQGKVIETCSFFNESSMLTETVGDVPFGQIRFQIHLEKEEFLDFELVEFLDAASKI